MTTPAEIAAILDKAADHIDKVGLFQGELYEGRYSTSATSLTECRVCAIGALNVALHGTPHFGLDLAANEVTAHDVADFYLRDRIGGVELAEWNDMPGRTQGDVTGLFRKAAADLRGGAR